MPDEISYLVLFPIVYVYTAVLWVVVLVLYNLLIDGLDMGALGSFAWKSAILVLFVALTVTFVPWGDFASLIIWWIGLMVIFKKDLWECRILVTMIWGVDFLCTLLVKSLLMASLERSPVSTV